MMFQSFMAHFNPNMSIASNLLKLRFCSYKGAIQLAQQNMLTTISNHIIFSAKFSRLTLLAMH